jgi:protein-S-isoprenylcysteine O-methyltransferase Ste14
VRLQTDEIGLATLILILPAWIGFAAIFLFCRKSSKSEETKRSPRATVGIALQSASFALVWSFLRPVWWPFPPSRAAELVLGGITVVLVYASCWFCLRAVRTLGKQWTYAARVIKGHELVTQGPYSIVRNPIYLGMFGLILATGLALSRWWALLSAVVIFLIGNRIRIRAEEQLLRETFGPQFDAYAGRVPAFLPRLL